MTSTCINPQRHSATEAKFYTIDRTNRKLQFLDSMSEYFPIFSRIQSELLHCGASETCGELNELATASCLVLCMYGTFEPASLEEKLATVVPMTAATGPSRPAGRLPARSD